MAGASRRTPVARRRNSVPNAAFVVAAAEAVPHELVGRASLVIVNFPWGSLLRGVLGCDDDVLAGLASLLQRGGRIEALVSLTGRDAHAAAIDLARLDDSAAIGDAWASAGLSLTDARRATREEIAASRSSWAKRLGAGEERPTNHLVGRRVPPG
ncbi:MAG TPA: hypothetical protein VGK63_03550 [Candidatus Limnocylindrales bacterium]